MEKDSTISCRKTSEILKLIPSIPSFQRLVDFNRVNDIFTCIKNDIEAGIKCVLPGCIIFAKNNKKYWIIDGLHRLEVYKRVLKDMKIDLYINCDEITVNDEEEARILFNKVNDTRMLPEMPEGVNVSIVKGVVDYFVAKYPMIFSNSKSGKCHRPHIHFNGFQEALAKVLIDYPYLDDKDVIHSIEDMNEKFYKEDKSSEYIKYKENAKLKGGFYLGIVPNYGWLDKIFKNNSSHVKRQSIPYNIRIKVWVKQNGEQWSGKCCICSNTINITNFHCGHDIAVSKGGETVVDNLKPICSTCNLSMGTKTIHEMKIMFN